MDTELAEAPMTPTTRSGFGMMGGSPLEHRTSELSFWMRAWTKVRDCSSAYVSLEHVSSILAPRVMLGSRSGSLLIWSSAYNMASIRWIPFSFLISPHGTPAGPLECTGKSPPRVMSPSIFMEWVPEEEAQDSGVNPIITIHMTWTREPMCCLGALLILQWWHSDDACCCDVIVAAMQGAGSSATAQCFLLYLRLLWRNETKDVHEIFTKYALWMFDLLRNLKPVENFSIKYNGIN